MFRKGKRTLRTLDELLHGLLHVLRHSLRLLCQRVPALLHGLALVSVLYGVVVGRYFGKFDSGFEFTVFGLEFFVALQYLVERATRNGG